MGRLFRYLAPQLAGWIALATVGAVALFVVSQVVRVAPLFTGADGRVAAAALGWLLIPVLGWALAPALLVAIFAVFGRMEADGELTAIDAAGIPRWRLAAAPLALAALLAGVLGWVSLWGGPACQRALRAAAFELAGESLVGRLQPGVFHAPAPGITAYSRRIAEGASPDDRGRSLLMEGVFVEDARDTERPLLLLARRASMSFDPAAGMVELCMLEGTAFQELAGGGAAAIEFDELTLRVDVLGELTERLGFIPYQLAAPTRRLLEPPPAGVTPAEWSFAFWRRLAAPIGLLVLAAAGLVIVFSSRLRGRTAGLAMAAGLFFGLHLAGRLGEVLALEGAIPAWLAALGPCAIVLVPACIAGASR